MRTTRRFCGTMFLSYGTRSSVSTFTISILIRLVCRLLEIAHTILCVQIIYHYLIIHFGNTESGLDRIVWYVAHIEMPYVTPLKTS